jgi:hypothetical protein
MPGKKVAVMLNTVYWNCEIEANLGGQRKTISRSELLRLFLKPTEGRRKPACGAATSGLLAHGYGRREWIRQLRNELLNCSSDVSSKQALRIGSWSEVMSTLTERAICEPRRDLMTSTRVKRSSTYSSHHAEWLISIRPGPPIVHQLEIKSLRWYLIILSPQFGVQTVPELITVSLLIHGLEPWIDRIFGQHVCWGSCMHGIY